MTKEPVSTDQAGATHQLADGLLAPRQGFLRSAASKLFVPALILVGGGAIWMYAVGGWKKDTRDSLPADDPAATSSSSQMMVTAEPITLRPVQRFVEVVGTLYGFEEVVISAKVEGRVLRLHHEVADRVAPDEPLTEIDPTDYRLAEAQAVSNLHVELAKLGLEELPDKDFDLSKVPTVMLAQARVENMQSRKERTERLSALNAASKGDLENAVSEFRTAEADRANQVLLAKSGLATIQLRQSALEVAKQQLADTQIRVPRPRRKVPGLEHGITYVITKRLVSEGSFVRAGGEICRLAIDKTLKLRVPVPEQYSAQIKLGQQTNVFTAAFETPFQGVVTLINPAVSPTTRTFEVEIQIANSSSSLKPGSFAKAVIQTNQTEGTPTAPLSALVSFAGVTKVFLAENGRAREVIVTPGIQTHDWVEIANPKLPEGAVVITSGQSKLANESPVTIRETTIREASGAAAAGSRALNSIPHSAKHR